MKSISGYFRGREIAALTHEKVQLEMRCDRLSEQATTMRGTVEDLKDETFDLNNKVNDLTRTKALIEDEQKHRIKMREEQVGIEKDKALAKKDEECAKKIYEVRQEYQEKLTKQLEKRGTELKEMYSEILTRLPDVNMRIRDTHAKVE